MPGPRTVRNFSSTTSFVTSGIAPSHSFVIS
jgi:hypothetical protein